MTIFSASPIGTVVVELQVRQGRGDQHLVLTRQTKTADPDDWSMEVFDGETWVPCTGHDMPPEWCNAWAYSGQTPIDRYRRVIEKADNKEEST